MSASPGLISMDGIKTLQAGITGGISATISTYHHPYRYINSHMGTEIHSTANQINIRNSFLGRKNQSTNKAIMPLSFTISLSNLNSHLLSFNCLKLN
ncbi:Uncharacterized protein TCM_013707 [Theobroma cacao]|uniref:Uncharacterized protein n=1 Tax=Theobroma cacao TaxID=3641 RepID=A0A061FVZ8_THECC|nr:Uncharacterized protein TCM_013707 [Theobroma cacao]